MNYIPFAYFINITYTQAFIYSPFLLVKPVQLLLAQYTFCTNNIGILFHWHTTLVHPLIFFHKLKWSPSRSTANLPAAEIVSCLELNVRWSYCVVIPSYLVVRSFVFRVSKIVRSALAWGHSDTLLQVYGKSKITWNWLLNTQVWMLIVFGLKNKQFCACYIFYWKIAIYSSLLNSSSMHAYMYVCPECTRSVQVFIDGAFTVLNVMHVRCMYPIYRIHCKV